MIVKKGGKITSCYFAPELKSEEKSLRKPNPGMALQAKRDFPEVDFNREIAPCKSPDSNFCRAFATVFVLSSMAGGDDSGVGVSTTDLAET